jgi:hypothetical protein
MTERLANPLFTRASTISLPSTDDVRLISIIPVTSELLFELYSAPSVTYGIDSLFAFSRHRHQDGLAVSLGHNASTVIPVVNGRGVLSRAKRYAQLQIRFDPTEIFLGYHGEALKRQRRFSSLLSSNIPLSPLRSLRLKRL